MKSLGLSPTEQEVVDMQNEMEKNGRIFFPDFCKLVLRKFREFDEENFKQELFKVYFILYYLFIINVILPTQIIIYTMKVTTLHNVVTHFKYLVLEWLKIVEK